MLENLVEEVFARRPKEYIYKVDSQGRLVTGTVKRKDNHRIGSAIATFRNSQIQKSKFPCDFWKA